jgi:hypothetical protein
MLLVREPAGLTKAEREAFAWAVSGLEEAMTDTAFLAENPSIEYDADDQRADLRYRLEEQAREMVDVADPASVRFARAAKRAASKML